MTNQPHPPHQPPAGDDDRRVVAFDTDRRRTPESGTALPAADAHQPILRLPPMIKVLCALILVVFAAQQALPPDVANALVWWGGFIPARYSGTLPFDAAALWSPLTHALLHGGWLHLGMNIGMLMAFGAGIEKQRGAKGLLFIFIASTLGGAVTQFVFYSDSIVPMIGASGGISGLFGAALMEMAQHATRHDPRWIKRVRHVLPFVAVWVGTSLFFGVAGMPGESQPVAWAAHVGGFIAGMLTVLRRA